MINGMQMCSLALFLESLAGDAAELETIRDGIRKALEKDYREHYVRYNGEGE